MIDLTAVIDNEEAIRKFRELRNIARNATTSVVTDADRMDYAMQRFAATLGKIGVGVSLAGLVRQIAATRGEFQQLEVAFTTLLQSKEKADALMSQMVDLAAKTPFDLKGVADGARQLLAYGFAAEDVTGTLTRLGNVAAGLGLPLERLTYLYGTTAVQGRLYARDMLQFTSSGIPVLQEMAKMYGKTTEEINEMVSAGKIGFEDVKKVIEGMTNEGGQFYNLMQEQSKTITGLISNLGDALDTMFNDIGKSQEGVIAGVLQGTISLVENYQKVLDILIPLVATYGAYRAALIATAAIEKVQATITATKAILEQTKMLTRATQAQILFNKAVKANPYVLAASALGALVSVIWRFSNRAKEAAKNAEGLARVNRQVAEQTDAEVARIKSLQDILSDTNAAYSARKKALDDLKSIVPSYHANLTEEGSLINNNTAALKAYITEFERLVKLQAAQDELTEAYKKQRQLQKELTKYEHDLAEARQYNSLVAQPSVSAKVGTSGLQAISMGAGSGVAKPTAEIENQIERIKSEISATNDIINELNNEITNTSFEEEASKTILSAIQNLTDAQNAYNEAVKAWEAAVSDGSDISVVKEKQGAVDAAKKALDEARKLAGVDEKTKKAVTKSQKELANLVLANDRALEQSRLDIMKEGLDKELAEIDFQTEQRKQAISKAREEEKEASGGKLTNEREQVFTTQMANLEAKANDERIAARKKYAKEYNKISKQIMDDTLSDEERKFQDIKDKYAEFRKWVETAKEGGSITLDQAGELEGKIKQAEENKVLLEKEKAWNEYLTKYGTFRERLQATKDEYDRKIAGTVTEGERSMLEAERDAALADFEVQASEWAQQLADMSIVQLDEMMREAQKKLEEARKAYDKLDSSSTSEAEGLRKTIIRLEAEIKKLKEQLSKASETAKTGDWGGMATAFNAIAETTRNAANGIREYDEGLANVLSTMGDIAASVGSFASAMGNIETSGASFENVMGGITSGISLATTVIGGLFNLFKRDDAIERTRRQFADLNDEIIRLKRESEINGWEGTIFGEDAFRNASENMNVFTEAYDRYNKTLSKIQKRGGKFSFLTGIKEWDSAAESIANMSVKTRHGTWFRSAKYESLGSLLPELFDDGELNMDALQKFTESDLFGKLAGENQELIKDLVDDWELYQDAIEATKDYLSGIFGDLGNTMTDALVDAFANGTNAAESFKDSVSGMLGKLAKDMIYSIQLAPLFEEAQKQMLTAMENASGLSPEKQFEQYTNIIDSLVSSVEGKQDDVMRMLEAFREAGNKHNLDLFTPDNDVSAQTASTRGYQVMSQDEGEEMNGRLSDVQAKTGNILAAVEFVKSLSAEQLNRTTDIRDIMIQLNGNVADIRSYTRVLPTMNETLTSMNRKLDNL